MLSVTRTLMRPTIACAYAVRLAAAAAIHTLPDLPYAYNVC
jgi:hypothetical protein